MIVMIRKTLATAKTTTVFFIAVANSFNPLAYRNISQKPIASILGYFLYFLLVLTLATAAFSLPSAMDAASKLTVKAEVATEMPVESSLPLLGNARVFINTTAGAKAEEHDIVIAGKELRSKPLPCLVRKEACTILGIKQTATPLEFGFGGKAKNGHASALLLLLPGILALSYLLMAVRYMALAIITAILAYAILKATKRGTSLADAMKIAAYAATVPAVLDTALLLLNLDAAIVSIVPLAAYATIVVAACALNDRDGSNSMI